MRRLILFAMAVCVVLGGAYLFLFKRAETVRAAKGYKSADTPQAAADMFKRAIEKRDYDIAAHYCTPGYAEQLRRGANAATELGEAIDNLNYQMTERGLLRDETKAALYAIEPFPRDFQITVSKENGNTAEAAFVFNGPLYYGNQPTAGPWNLKSEVFQAFTRSMRFVNATSAVVPMKKDGSEWKFDFPADGALQLRVGYLNDKYKNYINPLRMVTQEVKNDPSTRENTTNRLKSLLEQASKE
jgi:hypothetical protein